MPELPPLPAPNPVNQKKGKQNRAEGKAFEDRLDAAFDSRNHFILGEHPCQGGVRRDVVRTVSRFQQFEAKYTTSDRITQDRVSDEQSLYMDLATKLGARCYVIAGFQSGRAYRIPWFVWRDMKDHFRHKYVTEEELESFRIPVAWDGRLQILAERKE